MIPGIRFDRGVRGGQRLSAFLWLGIVMLGLALSACEINEESPGAAPADPADPGDPPVGGGPPGGDPPPPPPPPPSASDQQLFEATLYPHLTDAGNFCVGCHGVSQDPLFAVSDATTAYNAITSQQKVNLNNPALSRIYVRPADQRHNCGGDASCDRIAADFLAAIQDWAQQASAAEPPAGNDEPAQSAVAMFADADAGGSARAEDAQIALFTFTEGTGDVAMDTSGAGQAIALTIDGMEWVEGGGLRNVTGKAEAGETDSRKLYDMIEPAGEYTVEAWVVPDNNTQDGPARMVSYSQDTTTRNFTMGQNAIYYQLLNRSAMTDANGSPALEALDPEVETALTHVAMTFDAGVGRRIYINGALSIEEGVAGDTLDWLDDQRLVIGNEVTGDRPWAGVIRLVAIHDKALTAAEVQQNFAAGIGDVVTLRFDVSAALGQPARIEMQAAQIDAAGYLFAQPVYVGDATGVAIRNIRVGVNGGIPVAAQPFRRVDTVVQDSGTLLSPLGAVIPVELGPEQDRFHLEFQRLGDRQGTVEMTPPSSPPPPAPDEAEPELGLRTFAQINDTMSGLTGVDPNESEVLATYGEVRDSLPATPTLLAFASSQQIAIQRLATSYCGVVVGDDARCSALFGSCEIAGNAGDQVAIALYDRMIGDSIAVQPGAADVTGEIVRMIDDLGCTGGCNGAQGRTVLQAACAAVLSSAAITVN